MADIHIKDGRFTRVHNEIYEAFARTRIPGESRQVLDFIIRKTYGWKKKEDAISLSQFCIGTGLKKTTICKALCKLIEMNLITQKGNTIAKVYRFNKHFDTWKLLPKKVTLPKKVMSITQKGNNRYPKRVLQKKVLKETITNTSNEDKLLVNKNTNMFPPPWNEETGEREKRPEKKVNVSEQMKELLDWATKRRGAPFYKLAKQYKALSDMFHANISVSRIKNRYVELDNDEWRRKNKLGVDFMDVFNSLDKNP